MTLPLISIFIPYYNDKKTLQQAITSVLNQSYKHFELILFDHASTDGSAQLAHSFSDQRIVHLTGAMNYGAGSGINLWQHLSKMRGEYVKIFCADDVMLPNHLKDLTEKLESSPDLDFVISPRLNYIDSAGRLLSEGNYMIPPHILSSKNLGMALLKSFFNSESFIPWDNGLIRKRALEQLFPKDNSMIYLFDMSFWTGLLIMKAKLGLVDKDITNYRISDNNMLSIQYNKLHQACFFEHLSFLRLFCHIKNVSLAKELCEHVPMDIKAKISDDDQTLVPFLIALEYANNKKGPYRRSPIMNLLYPIVSYEIIYPMLQQDDTRELLQKKFNFTIKEFRELYTSSAYRPFFYKETKFRRLLNKLHI